MTDDLIVEIVNSPWFWTLFGFAGLYLHNRMQEHEEYNLYVFKDFTVMWISIGLFILGFSLQYSITYGLLEQGIGSGSWTDTIYFLIFVAIAIVIGRTLIKTEENTRVAMFTPFMQMLLAFSLGAVVRVIYEGGVSP